MTAAKTAGMRAIMAAGATGKRIAGIAAKIIATGVKTGAIAGKIVATGVRRHAPCAASSPLLSRGDGSHVWPSPLSLFLAIQSRQFLLF